MQEYNGKKGVWRTVGGRRIFIIDGEDLSSAMKKSGKFKLSKNKNDENKNQLVLSDEQKAAGDRLNKKAENGVREDINQFLSGKQDYSGSREDFINDLSNEWGVEKSKVEEILHEENSKHPRLFKTDRAKGKYDAEFKENFGNDKEFHAQMLGRMQSDMEYYWGNGEQNEKHLWYKDYDKQLEAMDYLKNSIAGTNYDSTISKDDIKKYRTKKAYEDYKKNYDYNKEKPEDAKFMSMLEENGVKGIGQEKLNKYETINKNMPINNRTEDENYNYFPINKGNFEGTEWKSLYAHNKNTNITEGEIAYTVDKNGVNIERLDVQKQFRRNKVATNIVNNLSKQENTKELNLGLVTKDGIQFWSTQGELEKVSEGVGGVPKYKIKLDTTKGKKITEEEAFKLSNGTKTYDTWVNAYNKYKKQHPNSKKTLMEYINDNEK